MNQPPVDSRGKHIAVLIIAFAILLPGAYGFLEKLMMFVLTLTSEKRGTFTLVPLANYLIVATGMACLFGWAVLHGMFRDVEQPKYKMLEREQMLEDFNKQDDGCEQEGGR